MDAECSETSTASAAPRVEFYQLLPPLTRRANQEDYPIALQAAKELSGLALDSPEDNTPSHSLASCPQDSQKLPTDAKRSEASTAAPGAAAT